MAHRWTREEIIDELHRWTGEFGTPPVCDDWNKSRLKALGKPVHGEGYPSHETVRMNFGTWNQALIAAGLPPRPRGHPIVILSDQCVNPACDRERQRRKNNSSSRCSRCESFWYTHGEEWTEERGAEAAITRQMRAARERYARFIAMREAGMSNKAIAAQENLSVHAVASAFTNAKRRGFNVPRPPYWDRNR